MPTFTAAEPGLAAGCRGARQRTTRQQGRVRAQAVATSPAQQWSIAGVAAALGRIGVASGLASARQEASAAACRSFLPPVFCVGVARGVGGGVRMGGALRWCRQPRRDGWVRSHLVLPQR